MKHKGCGGLLVGIGAMDDTANFLTCEKCGKIIVDENEIEVESNE